MDIQIVVVGLVILFAAVYIGRIVLQKVKSFSSKQSCGSDCGCGVKDKNLAQKL